MSASLEEIQINTPLFAYSLGVRDEQERVIRLIEEVATLANKSIVLDPNNDNDLNKQKIAAVCYHLVALIKREQK